MCRGCSQSDVILPEGAPLHCITTEFAIYLRTPHCRMNARHLIITAVFVVAGIGMLHLSGCTKDAGPQAPADTPPTISTFTASPASIWTGDSVRFLIVTAEDFGLARAIFSYGDSSAGDTGSMGLVKGSAI